MASRDALFGEIGSLPQPLRAPMQRILTLLTKMRFGHPTDEVRSVPTNFDGAFLQGTTPAIANEDFTIAHGLPSAPYLLVPVLTLDVEGAQLVPLTVTRVADAKRIYLSSSAASAPFCCLVEG